MLLELSHDQAFFQETSARFLAAHAPVDELRRLRDDPTGFDRDYWKRGAELGWTSLLVAEEHGGGSISGRGLVDLTLIAYEFGHSAAPGPLEPTNVVAAALSDIVPLLTIVAVASPAVEVTSCSMIYSAKAAAVAAEPEAPAAADTDIVPSLTRFATALAPVAI